MVRKSTRRTVAAPAIDLSPYVALLATLDALAGLQAEPCPRCGRGERHFRCYRCNACQEDRPDQGECPACHVKASRYRTPVREWVPALPFAATFGRELAGKIRRGYVPTSGQVELIAKLVREAGRKPTAAERDALCFLTPRSPAWNPVLALVVRERFCFIGPEGETGGVHPRAYWFIREDVLAVRSAAREILADLTGWEVLANCAAYADALRVVGTVVGPRGKVSPADPVLEEAVRALLELHGWLLQEKRIVEA